MIWAVYILATSITIALIYSDIGQLRADKRRRARLSDSRRRVLSGKARRRGL